MQKEKGSDRSKNEFLTLGNEIIGGVRNIKGFDGVFMDERRLEEMKEIWKKGRGKKGGGCSNIRLGFSWNIRGREEEEYVEPISSLDSYQQTSSINSFRPESIS